MAKKVNGTFEAVLEKNNVKAGAWLATVQISYETSPTVTTLRSAWTNASAGKRWLKEQVIENTTKKSVKMIAGSTLDEKGKPVLFTGTVSFKVEA